MHTLGPIGLNRLSGAVAWCLQGLAGADSWRPGRLDSDFRQALVSDGWSAVGFEKKRPARLVASRLL